MEEMKLRAQIANQFGRPGTARLPGYLKRLPADLAKKGREVLKIRWGWLEGRGALKDDDLCVQSTGNFQSLVPRLPYLLRVAERSQMITIFGGDGGSESTISWARRRVRD